MESPIVVEFGDFGMTVQQAGQAGQAVEQTRQIEPVFANPTFKPFDQDQWLREEMQSLVEGMRSESTRLNSSHCDLSRMPSSA